MGIALQSFKIAFGTCCSFPAELDANDYEREYQAVYKPLISTLYNLPGLPFSLHLSGAFIAWIERCHPEFFMILEEMVSRKQIEILGGGFFSPLFPFLPPPDRVGQIELLTTEIRKHLGKRPRGAWIPLSAWEPSMIASLNTCGIEYVLLDRIMLETSGFPGITGREPVTIEDVGKTIAAFPLDNRYRYLERFSPKSFLDDLAATAGEGETYLSVFIDPASIAPLFTSGEDGRTWFHSLIECIPTRGAAQIELSLPGRYLKGRTLWKRAYIPGGMSPFDHDPLLATEDIAILARTPVKQYLLRSKGAMNLYAKMMYVHALVNQLRGDKSRKKNACEELWKAQGGDVFILSAPEDSERVQRLHARAYKDLLVAEKTARVRGVFSPSVTAFDFDMDGLKEYLCQLDRLNVYVHPFGGKVFELDVLEAYRNYCDLCGSEQGLFIDHFVDQAEIDDLRAGILPHGKPVFSDTVYQDVSIDSTRHEIQLKTNGYFGSLQQPLSLRKQYSFRNEGIQVQYILKNDSPLALSGNFLIELDLAVTRTRQHDPLMTVYAHDQRADSRITEGQFDDVSWIQLSDLDSGVRFTVDANENPSVSVLPIMCSGSAEGDAAGHCGGTRLFLSWKVDLGPGYEMEKMVFLKIDA
ncbi:MAG TPA: DUF1926 domain-containing protein [Treponemataceae bacterium]|nr:DUF1926 domain-containing protein [Treponemataceae bacterium]HPS43097.1 DUF1926 domain-containing protein [Treponemataceae bacterium]